jgi:YegS/Rv2252/BmrU family lipid kinase
MVKRTRALIVFNPTAGQAETLARELQAARDLWREAGWEVDLQPTVGPGDGTQIARQAAADGYQIVVAAGGDGTINEVINGLKGTQTALAALPVGTVNVWVREIGFPLQPRAAAEALLQARVEQVDLGLAGGRHFLLMAGVGFDAAVTGTVRSDTKRRFGALAYVLQMLQVATRWRGTRVKVTLDGKPVRGRVLMVVLGNTQLYAGFLRLTVRAQLNDGLLDVCIIRGKSLWGVPLRMLALITRRYDLDPEIEYHRARQVIIDSRRPLPVQVDGDFIGHTPMTFEAVPNALFVLLPPNLPADDLLRTAEPRSRRMDWRRWFRGVRQPTTNSY